MTEKLLQVNSVSRSFGDLQAVKDLTMQVRGGEIFGLMGPDGAGKTTLMRIICGALLPDTGEVLVNGISMNKSPDQARSEIGYLSQRFSMYEDLTVLENLRFFAEVRGLAADVWRPRTLEILDFVGLGEFTGRLAGRLSGGMKQKLGLAASLVHRPRLLLLDEPTGGVDPVTRQDFWQLLIRLVREEHVGVLVSTPYMDEAVRCTYVGMMAAGSLVLEGPPSELRNALEGQILQLRGAPLLAWRRAAANLPDVLDIQVSGTYLHLRVAPGRARAVTRALKQLARERGLSLETLAPTDPLLEDVFNAAIVDHVSTEGLYQINGVQHD
ncbi:MAG: ABC transporter ATP-binding protein [Anaerolineales bacterium]|nr:ABC transporter ATP-binding protein [Anaerolineales bacterium]